MEVLKTLEDGRVLVMATREEVMEFTENRMKLTKMKDLLLDNMQLSSAGGAGTAKKPRRTPRGRKLKQKPVKIDFRKNAEKLPADAPLCSVCKAPFERTKHKQIKCPLAPRNRLLERRRVNPILLDPIRSVRL